MKFFGEVTLIVNGKKTPTNPFVTNLLGNIATAILASLTIEERPKDMELRVSFQDSLSGGDQ